MEEDIPQEDAPSRAVMILLLITILISVAGTLVVIEEAQKIKEIRGASAENMRLQASPQAGMIMLDVERPPESEAEE